ncbi:MAG: UDP-N-acetylenolpyruvoylglucosamine reductase, partial [Pseudomonadota bacterium]
MLNPKELLALPLSEIRGRYTMNAPLGSVGWFRTGGTADVLCKPADIEDLQCFMRHCPKNIPIT